MKKILFIALSLLAASSMAFSDWQRNSIEDDVFGKKSAKALDLSITSKTLAADGQAHQYITPDRTLYRAQTQADGSVSCVVVDSTGAYGPTSQIIFQETINPSPATRFIEVSFTAQVNMPDLGNNDTNDGIGLICEAYQADNPSVVEACSATPEQPFLVRRSNNGANFVMTSYHGYIQVDSVTNPVTVKVGVVATSGNGGASQSAAQVCYSNLILRW